LFTKGCDNHTGSRIAFLFGIFYRLPPLAAARKIDKSGSKKADYNSPPSKNE
jgi:hypothetical protein